MSYINYMIVSDLILIIMCYFCLSFLYYFIEKGNENEEIHPRWEKVYRFINTIHFYKIVNLIAIGFTLSISLDNIQNAIQENKNVLEIANGMLVVMVVTIMILNLQHINFFNKQPKK